MRKKMSNDSARYDLKAMGERIKKRRRDMGFTQDFLAQRAGCSATHLSRIEGGASTSLERLFRICDALSMSLDEVLGLSTQKSGPIQSIETSLAHHCAADQVLAAHLLEELLQILDVLRTMQRGYSLSQAMHKLGIEMKLYEMETVPTIGYGFHGAEEEMLMVAEAHKGKKA